MIGSGYGELGNLTQHNLSFIIPNCFQDSNNIFILFTSTSTWKGLLM
jgi:hypothetical protein